MGGSVSSCFNISNSSVFSYELDDHQCPGQNMLGQLHFGKVAFASNVKDPLVSGDGHEVLHLLTTLPVLRMLTSLTILSMLTMLYNYSNANNYTNSANTNFASKLLSIPTTLTIPRILTVLTLTMLINY